MINPPAEILTESAPEVVPIGVLNLVGMQLAIDVDEAPGDSFFEGHTRINVEVGIPFTAIWVIHIDRLRRDIEVANPNGRLLGIEVGREVALQPFEPGELVNVFLGLDGVPLRNVAVDDGNAVYDGLDNSKILVVRSFMKTVGHRIRGGFG